MKVKQVPDDFLVDEKSSIRATNEGRFSVYRLTLNDMRTPKTTWARELRVAYTPTIVFLDRGKEVFRIDTYLRPFHLASALDYVASRAYRKEPSFQRYLQSRTERLRGRGDKVDLWN